MTRLKIILAIFLATSSVSSLGQAQGCKDIELRDRVSQVAKAEGVEEKELLSIIAHESSCHYYVIAWNLPKQPKTARSKFFSSLEEAKSFTEALIATGQYRVDVGIGQINNEANIKPRGWTLDEVLDPKTALNRVAQILKAQGWENYHSRNSVYAKKWQGLALAALNRILSEGEKNSEKGLKALSPKIQNPLVVFNSLDDSNVSTTPQKPTLIVFNTKPSVDKTNPAWIIYGNL